jgi:AraC-like DNA-binding protein
MKELIFECAALGRERGYQGVRRKEYSEGDYQILPGIDVSVRIEKGLDTAYSIMNVRSSSPLRFRRNWRHIRHDKRDLSVLWFVTRGSIVFSQSGGRRVVRNGECMISRSLQPFQMECLLDRDSRHEVLQIVAPTQLVRSQIPDYVQPGATFSSQHGDGRLALRTFELLYEEGSTVSRKAAEGLAHQAICAAGSVFTAAHEVPPRSVGDGRFQDIVLFVQRQLGNPDLCVESVANELGISPRYVLHILKTHGTSFSQMMWKSRLACAQTWLGEENMRHLSIRQIAYMAGFKSPAHFSRMFRCATLATPRNFRRARLQ